MSFSLWQALSPWARKVTFLAFAGLIALGATGSIAPQPMTAFAQSCAETCRDSCVAGDDGCISTCMSNCSTRQDPNENPNGNPNSNSATTKLDLFNPLGDQSLTDLLSVILQGLIWLSIPVVTIMVIIGAYHLITSGGDPGKVKKGKEYVLYAAIGFGVLLLARSVTVIITNFLTPAS